MDQTRNVWRCTKISTTKEFFSLDLEDLSSIDIVESNDILRRIKRQGVDRLT